MAQVSLLPVLSVDPQPILATGIRGETPKREASATPRLGELPHEQLCVSVSQG